mmetsp:Transcript_68303/g.134046  ORF Transcript_68303/g.134046 Transcript_68303/m.134046 type:complete len:219 (-) Transcript_68303:794-1450(-)
MRDGGLFPNLVRHALGLLQPFDQRNVLRDVALRCGQLEQNVVLQVAHLDLEPVLLADELFPQRRQVGLLLAHHKTQQLVLQTAEGHHEVDQCALGLDLGGVVRVGELGVQVQLELGVQLHFRVAQFQVLLLAADDGRALDHRVQHCLHGLPHVLDEHRLPVLQRALHLPQHVFLVQPHDLQVAVRVRLQVSHPLDALQLRVDHERPPRRVGDDAPVLA